MNKSRELRDSLAVLADELPLYWEALRHAGFSCCHVTEDWITQTCTESDVAIHRRYLIEYAREALVSDDASTIVYEDGPNCRSAWLNEIKAKRFAEFGPVHAMNTATTDHLKALSPCLRERRRIAQSSDSASRKHQTALVETFSKRRKYEIKLHGPDIRRCTAKLGVQLDEIALQAFYAARLVEAFAPMGGRLVHTKQMYGPKDAISFNLSADSEFVVLPSISSSVRSGDPVTDGSVGMGFRITSPDALTANEYESSKYVVAHLYTLLPNEFFDYGRFNSRDELCLNILAWRAALQVLLPAVLQVLYKSCKC